MLTPFNFFIGVWQASGEGKPDTSRVKRKKISYNVWADIVNTASRMQSHGVPGQIQVSESTYRLINDDFVREPRGTVRVKGEMQVCLVVSARENF